jgi:hypothetical protein
MSTGVHEQLDWIDRFVKYTNNTEPPEVYRRWVAISTIASVLQRKCWLNWGNETFYPNMYIVLVGPPAARKGTAMRIGKGLLDRLGIPVAADETSRQKLIKSLQEATSVDQGRASGEINFHSSLTIHASELTVFLGTKNIDLLSMLCKWYDCESRYIYDTHSRGKEEVQNVWAHLLGATTPGQLQAALPEEAFGSGFTSRVVFVYAANKGKRVIKPTLNTALEEPLSQDLSVIRNIHGEFSFTDEAAIEARYEIWYDAAEDGSLFTDPRMDYYVQRRPTHLWKLAMIHSAARSVVTIYDVEKAINVLEATEQEMEQVFAGVGANPLARVQLRLLRVLEERKTMKTSEIHKMFFSDVSRAQLADIVAALEEMGHAQVDVINKRIKYIA